MEWKQKDECNYCKTNPCHCGCEPVHGIDLAILAGIIIVMVIVISLIVKFGPYTSTSGF